MEKEDIRRITEKYWGSFEPSRIDEAIRWYICEDHRRLAGKSLLEAELEYAREKGNITAKQCNTLVLPVGFSLEPLFQSICVHQPKKVVLLLNEQGYPPEEWHVFAGHITGVIALLVEKGLLSQAPQIPGENGKSGYPVADDPSAVFQKLVDLLHDETDVVIDVTGGKKSMISGAYLYAAYAKARISYVDFEEYDPKYRRPYGFSCKIREISNPYESFALREWERVRMLYNQYQFREARKLLHEVIQSAMTRVLPDSEHPIRTLETFLEYYEKWDSGDFGEAKEIASKLPAFNQPSAVEKLGDKWYRFGKSDFTNKPTHFYGDWDAVRVYAIDELARIRRLIKYNEDYRSAFLRAAGLNEVILVARLAQYADPSVQQTLLDVLDLETPSAYKLFDNLSRNDSFRWRFKKEETIKPFGKGINVHLAKQMNRWWQRTQYPNWEDFLNRRNQLAHTYFSVPRAWADNALEFVKANFEDFFGQSPDSMGLHTEALEWPELCRLCGLDRFLPPNLR